MTVSEFAGRPPEPSMLVDVDKLVRAYYERRPDPSEPSQRVAFGTSGHRGSAFEAAFNQAHILATTEAICRYRRQHGIRGPLFLGRDTHALSEPAFRTAVEVLAGNDVEIMVDIEAIRGSGIRLGVDPLGGASVAYWQAIGERHRLDLEVVNDRVDPRFAFMRVDSDGKIRMDPSSPYAMAGLVELKDRFDVAFANDADADRHGIVTPGAGLLNPNHYLAVAISDLFGGHRDWPGPVAVGKTVVSSSMIDRVVADLGRRLVEVPVGFKWFVDGLLDGSLGFGGEESAGASFLRRDGSVWTTDKDGIVLCLLAAEITATAGHDPGVLYEELADRFGRAVYRRIDAPASAEQKEALKDLSPEGIEVGELAGEKITEVTTSAPGNGAPIGGLKVVAEHGWFAARPSGTEDVYKLYAESFLGDAHLERIIDEAQRIITRAMEAASP